MNLTKNNHQAYFGDVCSKQGASPSLTRSQRRERGFFVLGPIMGPSLLMSRGMGACACLHADKTRAFFIAWETSKSKQENPMSQPSFYDPKGPLSQSDALDNAASVVAFLSEVLARTSNPNDPIIFSDNSACGLLHVLGLIEQTLEDVSTSIIASKKEAQ